jgi:hypothetical protein
MRVPETETPVFKEKAGKRFRETVRRTMLALDRGRRLLEGTEHLLRQSQALSEFRTKRVYDHAGNNDGWKIDAWKTREPDRS